MCQESLQRGDRLIDLITNLTHLVRRENHGVRRNVAMTSEIDAESGQCVQDFFGFDVSATRIDHGSDMENTKTVTQQSRYAIRLPPVRPGP